MKVVLQNLTKIFPSRDKKAGKEVVELPGVMPNPTVEKLNESILAARENVDILRESL